MTVWAWVNDELKTWGDDKTHEDMLGDKKYNCWRGRYEGYTKTLSFVPFTGCKIHTLPNWLYDNLERKFGEFQAHGFKPQLPPRVKGHKKIGLSMSPDVIENANEAARKCGQTLSGFFELAAKKEIARVNATPEE